MQETADTAATSATPAPPPEVTPLELPEWAPEPLARLWETVQTYPLLGAVIIVAFFFVAAKIAQFIFNRFITQLTKRTETDLDDQILELLQRPVFLSVFLWGLALATRSLELPAVFTATTVQILKTLLVLVWMTALFRVCRLLLDALSRNHGRFSIIEERTIPLFDMVAKLLVLGGASYAILMVWGINPTAWLASAGVVGIAVGFAAKDTLANLFAGFFILADAPYKLGDFVVLDSGERGRVTHVGIRSTRLLTRDDIEITLPNAVIANSKIINESGGPWEKERVRIKIGVAYGSDVDEVCKVLKAVAVSHEHICPEPEPRVRMRTFGASSLDFELLAWIDEPVLRGKLMHQLNMEVYKALNEANIEIPYAKQDIYIKEMPGSAGSGGEG